MSAVADLPADWLPRGWQRVTVQGQAMVDAGEHGIMPLADALALRDMLVTTSRRPGWAK